MNGFQRILIFLFCALLLPFAVSAQNQKVRIYGQVQDSLKGEALSFVTVLLRGKVLDQPIIGTTTDDAGRFELFCDSLDFTVEIRMIGYNTKYFKTLEIVGQKVDLGRVQLVPSIQNIEEMSAQGERSLTEFRLDKRVFHVGQDIGSSGSSALELLNNVPSVTVNLEGVISLRGSSGVQILIDGKPSAMSDDPSKALGTITADMIEKIEVITNPSANYQSEGTSGIINIVLKKEEKKGFNGSISVNTGLPHSHSLGISLNRRSEHFNLFTQIGAGYRSMPRYISSINENRLDSTVIESEGVNYRNEQFYNLVLGTDYHINARNVLTLAGNVSYEVEQQPSETNFSRRENGVLVSEWQRMEETEGLNPKYQYDLQYKKEFKDTNEHTLLFTTLGKFFGKSQSSEFSSRTISGLTDYAEQKADTRFKQADYTFSLDYVKPFNKVWKIETGAQYVINDVGNRYEVQNVIADVWTIDDSLSNDFQYKQKVLGMYVTGAMEKKKWGIKLGLRLENTDLSTRLVTTNVNNHQRYTNLFPTAHTSVKLSRYISLQAGYSRRINRPRLWDLNPFFSISNNFNIRRGNPELQPEFTDSYELTSIYILKKASINFGVYYRYTTDVVERVSIFENNVNTTLPMNIGLSNTVGLEFNGKYTPAKWVTINGDFNYNYFQRQGTFQSQVFDFTGDKWTSKLTTRFKLTKMVDFELSGNYESRFKTVQGSSEQTAFLDAGVRVKVLKGKGVIDFSVRDLFASRIQRSSVDQTDFYLYSNSKQGRFFTLGFTYGFGKGEAMTYSGAGHRH